MSNTSGFTYTMEIKSNFHSSEVVSNTFGCYLCNGNNIKLKYLRGSKQHFRLLHETPHKLNVMSLKGIACYLIRSGRMLPWKVNERRNLN